MEKNFQTIEYTNACRLVRSRRPGALEDFLFTFGIKTSAVMMLILKSVGLYIQPRDTELWAMQLRL